MGAKGTAFVAVIGGFLSIQLSACHWTTTSTTESVRNDPVFLHALDGPIRAKYPDSVLIAEGEKACDAFAQGQNEGQVMDMIKKDLDVDAGQFIGAVYGGMNCVAKS